MWKKRRNFWDLLFRRKKSFTKKEHFFISIDEIQEFEKKYGYFSEYPLVGKVSSGAEDVDLVKNLLEAIHPQLQTPEQRLFIVGEILTKVLAYRDLKVGMDILIPFQEKKTLYTVEKVFDLWHGMPAFGLVPHKNSLSPILLFRGTDFTFTSKRGLSSILSDLDFSGPGYTTFFNARHHLQKWLKEKAKKGKKARVMGFSLGGAFASYVSLYERDNISLDEPSLVYHTPGVHRKIFIEWGQVKAKHQPPLLVFIHPNDVVSKVGTILGSIYTISSKPQLPPLSAHVSLVSAQNEFACHGE
ncbi:MAG: hypothetical protein WCP39_01925 [Chlamydiota bacterium]